MSTEKSQSELKELLGYIITEKKEELAEIVLAGRCENIDFEVRTSDEIFIGAFEGSFLLKRPDVAVMLCDSFETCALLEKLGVHVINGKAMDITARERLYLKLMNTGLCLPRSLLLAGNRGTEDLNIQFPCMLAWEERLGIIENAAELRKACTSAGKKLVFEKINGEKFNCFVAGNALISQNVPEDVKETALRVAASTGLEYGCITLIKRERDIFVDSVSLFRELEAYERQQAAEALVRFIKDENEFKMQ